MESFDKIITFFTERYNQELAIKTVFDANLVNLKDYFHSSEQKWSGSLLYPSQLRACFKEFDEYHNETLKDKRSKVRELLRDITQNRLAELQINFSSRVCDYQDFISNLKANISTLFIKTQKEISRYEEYAGGKYTQDKDALEIESAICEAVLNEIEALKILGMHSTKYWSEVMELEFERFECIKECVRDYIREMDNLDGGNNEKGDKVIEIFDQIDSQEELMKLYEAPIIISSKYHSVIKNALRLSENLKLELVHVCEYLMKFNYGLPDNRDLLVLREWDAFIEEDSFSNIDSVSIVLTRDKNLLIMNKSATGVMKTKALLSLRDMRDISIIRPEINDLLVVEVIKVERGIVVDSSYTYRLKFDTESAAQDFIDFVTEMKGI